jgi:hypothetical protein
LLGHGGLKWGQGVRVLGCDRTQLPAKFAVSRLTAGCRRFREVFLLPICRVLSLRVVRADARINAPSDRMCGASSWLLNSMGKKRELPPANELELCIPFDMIPFASKPRDLNMRRPCAARWGAP